MTAGMNLWDLEALDVEPHQPVVLQSDEGAARVIAINLPRGEELGEHEVHEHAWLHVHRGTVQLTDDDGNSSQAGAGGLAYWAPHERHTVAAVEDALVLLVLAPWPGPGHPSLP